MSVAEATDVPCLLFESVCILECQAVAKIGCINEIVALCGEKHSGLGGGTRGGACQRVNLGINRKSDQVASRLIGACKWVVVKLELAPWLDKS